MTHILLILAILVTFCWPAFAQTISGISGTINNGESITISGSSFGVKSPAAPLSWLGSNIDAGSGDFSATGWSQVSVTEVNAVYSTARSNSGKSILFAYDLTNNWSQLEFDSGTETEQWYVTAYYYLDYGGSCESFQWKQWRINSHATYLHDAGTTILNDWWTDGETWFNSGNVQVYYNSGDFGGSITATSDQAIFNQWQRGEGYYKMSSAPSTADGFTWFRRVGRSGDMLASSGLTTHDSDDPLWRYLRIGLGWTNPTNCGAEDTFYLYIDDIYIDNTLARVEIGNSINFADCTHREIQIPSSWSTSQVVITINRGSFGATDTAYLFVVDSSGNVSDGYEITFGDTAGIAQTAVGVSIIDGVTMH